MPSRQQLSPDIYSQDYAKILLRHGSDVTLQKLEIGDGESSVIKIGEQIRGQILRHFAINEPLYFEDGRNTTEVTNATVDEKTNVIRLDTATSVYEVTDINDPVTLIRKRILDYFTKGHLNETENVVDGFMDGGRGLKFSIDENGMIDIYSTSREIIIVDTTRDYNLRVMIAESGKLIANVQGIENKIKILSLYVSNRMGGSQPISPRRHIVDMCRQDINSIQKNNRVYLGEVQYGVCRHRALLLKRLCDEHGIPCRLVHGNYADGGHAWDIVPIADDNYLVDVMLYPTQIYQEDSPEAEIYKRIRGKGIPAGGVGGHSVWIP